MDQVNRRSALTLGAAALAGLVVIPAASQNASAEEHSYRHRKLHDATVALRVAREEIEHTSHNWGGEKRETLEAIDRALRHLDRLRDWHE